jgi:hypothetical protein
VGAGRGVVLRRIAEGLSQYAGSLDASDALQVETELFYVSPASAEQAEAAIRSMAASLGRATGPLKSLSDSMKLRRESGVVRVRASVPFAMLAALH